MPPSKAKTKSKRVRPTLINIFSGKHKPVAYLEAKHVRARPRSCNSLMDAIKQTHAIKRHDTQRNTTKN